MRSHLEYIDHFCWCAGDNITAVVAFLQPVATIEQIFSNPE